MSVQAHELAIFPASRTGWEEAFGADCGRFKDSSKTHMTNLRPQTSNPLDNADMSNDGNEEMDQNPDEAGWGPLQSLAVAGDWVEGNHTLTNSILFTWDATLYLE